jgi:hypothetical protein
MVIQKVHLWAIAVLIACAALFFIQRADSKHRVSQQRTSAIVSCKATSVRTALTAAFMLDASRTRARTGDTGAAARYEGFAHSIIATIPATPAHRGDPELADVQQQENPRTAGVTYALTERARLLQDEGCNAAYPKP